MFGKNHLGVNILISNGFLIIGSGSCPECKVSLKRNNYRLQLFEDATVEKEVDIRKRILKDYNKKEDDFDTLEEYNDYLEEVETIIYNLCNNIDIAETTKKVEQYRKENKEVIMRNKMRYTKEASELDRLIQEERQNQLDKREASEKLEVEIKRRKIMEKEALIDELMFSDNDAKEILNYFAESKSQVKTEKLEETDQKVIKKDLSKRISHFSSGVKISDSLLFAKPLPKIEEGPLFVYVEPKVMIDGPPYPSWENLEKLGYLKHVRQETMDEKGGGFYSALSCMRALQEAMFGLYNTPIKSEIA